MLADVDWKTMTPAEYFDSMSGKKALYKTASILQGEVSDTVEPFLKEGKDVILVSLSTALSGTYQSMTIVAKQLLEKYPERKIECVDSLRYSGAISFLLALASAKKAQGASFEETVEYMNEVKHRIHQMGPLDDLFFCVKTGRISNFKAFFGTLVGVHCLADFNTNGLSEVIGKVKGKQSAFDVTVEYIKRTIKNPEDQIIFISHSNRAESAELFAQRIKDEIKPKEVIINSIGMSCGASIGPGLCAAYYLGEKVSENLTEEKDILNTIVQERKKK